MYNVCRVYSFNPKQDPWNKCQMNHVLICILLLVIRKAWSERIRHKHLLQRHLKAGKMFDSCCAFPRPWDLGHPESRPTTQRAPLLQQTGARRELLAAGQPLALCFRLPSLMETIPTQKAVAGLFEECLILSPSPSTPTSRHGKLKWLNTWCLFATLFIHPCSCFCV